MSDPQSPAYAKLPRNTINRYGKPRGESLFLSPCHCQLARDGASVNLATGRYDAATINSIVSTTQVLHVSFPVPDDPFPAMIPMLGFVGSYADASLTPADPLDLYLHGYISSRLMRLGQSASPSSPPGDRRQQEQDPYAEDEHTGGFPLTIAATHLDGLVLALTPNHHSYNYRSAVMHGFARAVDDAAEKLWAMERITDGVLQGRWAGSRTPPTKAEMTSTQILRVRIVDASAKVRRGPPGDDRADLRDGELRAKTWSMFLFLSFLLLSFSLSPFCVRDPFRSLLGQTGCRREDGWALNANEF